MSAAPLACVRPIFRALAEAVLPDGHGLDEEGWRRAEEIVEGALDQRTPRVRRQLILFLRLLDWLFLLRHGERLGRAPRDRRARFLKGLQTSPFLLVRRGVWGVRTLVYMGYYGQEPVRRRIGYRADPRGWRSREGT